MSTTPNAPTAREAEEPYVIRRARALREKCDAAAYTEADGMYVDLDDLGAITLELIDTHAALLAARREVEARDARVDELEEAARSAVDARELFDSLGIPPEMQDACFSDDTQDWIAWTFRSYLAALAATQEEKT